MAPKNRVPNPPRRPRGPQQRRSAGTPDERRTRLVLYAVAGSGLVALALVVAFLALRGGGDGGGDVKAAMEAAGCTLTSTPAQPGTHVNDFAAKTDWNTTPPTSGVHHEQPAIWGAYEEPLQLVQVVHNLEHGGVYILYGKDVPPATVTELRAFYDEDPNGLLLAPQPDLGDRIALGAWVDEDPGQGDDGLGHLAKCPRYDEGAFSAFVDAYRFKGPERFPAELLTPGS